MRRLTRGTVTTMALAFSMSCGGSSAVPTRPSAPGPAATPVAAMCLPSTPPMSSINVEATINPDSWTVGAFFLVGPDPQHCASAGFTDGRAFCFLGVQSANPCDLSRIGIATDTGLPGPTWTLSRADGTSTFCTGAASGCAHTADPFRVNAYASGTYRACLADGSCGFISVSR